ncbi:MAG: hypothetical protein ACD_55C00124G0001, partial [uncultured bacterium]
MIYDGEAGTGRQPHLLQQMPVVLEIEGDADDPGDCAAVVSYRVAQVEDGFGGDAADDVL